MHRTSCVVFCSCALLAFVSCQSEVSPDGQAPSAPPTSPADAGGGPKAKLSPEAETALTKFRGNLEEELAASAGIPLDQLSVITHSGMAPSLTDHDNQPLTLLLLCEFPESEKVYAGEPEALREEFQFLAPGFPKPVDLVAWALSSKQLQQKHGKASYLQTSGIRKVEAELRDQHLQGKVWFQGAELFAGMVEFTAVWRDGKWQIARFRLPIREVSTTLQPDGSWQARRSEQSPGRDVALPRVETAFPRNRDSFPRFVVWIRPTPGAPILYQGGDLADASQLAERAAVFGEQHQVPVAETVVEIRADQDIAAEDLDLTLEQLSAIGFKRLSLAVATEGGTVGDLWLHTDSRANASDESLLPIHIHALAAEDGALVSLRVGETRLPIDALTSQVVRLTGRSLSEEPRPFEVELAAGKTLRVRHLADILQRVSLYRDADGKVVPLVDYTSLHVEP
ncbi:MAG: hypothetical protein RIC55_15165 [Pirellulaceae bacterium]